MSRYFDVRGKPITMEQWAIAFEYAPHTIRHTELVSKTISTVWLGLDHSFDGGKPLIFETMVFPDLDCKRYSTVQEAIKGHEQMVRKWRRK